MGVLGGNRDRARYGGNGGHISIKVEKQNLYLLTLIIKRRNFRLTRYTWKRR